MVLFNKLCLFLYIASTNKEIDDEERKKDCQNRIRVVLADRQITNRWLADQMGVTDMTVPRWKTNKIQPSMAQFVEIVCQLHVDIKELLEVDLGKETKMVSDIDNMAKELADKMTIINI